jgi:hypothetical protein
MERQRFRREREGISLRRIAADRATLAKWARVLPPKKDQIFLPRTFSPSATQGLRLEKLAPGISRKDWDLLDRSWFAYLANRAAYRIVMPAGRLAKLPPAQLLALKKIQIKLKNPALVPSRLLPASLREPGAFTWLTAGFFQSLRPNEKIVALQAWDGAGKFTRAYPRTSLSSLEAGHKKILKDRQLLNLVNTFATTSGPNCFAATAFALTGKHLKTWLHAEPFLKIVRRAGYHPTSEKPRANDILICRLNGDAVHAAFYLGGFVFEKPGQDLYEPYRLLSWGRWKKDWSHTRFEAWTRK